MFHEDPPASLDEFKMRSHFEHSTPVGRPLMWSGQAPMVVPCSMLELEAPGPPRRCDGNDPRLDMADTGDGEPLRCEVGVSAGEMLGGLRRVSLESGNNLDGGSIVILGSDLTSGCEDEDFWLRGSPVEAKADRKLVMAPGDNGGLMAAEGVLMTGSRKDRVTSLSFPTLWMMAELFSDSSRVCFSSSVISMAWDSTQWVPKDLAQEKESLQMKHMRMGLTGTTVGKREGVMSTSRAVGSLFPEFCLLAEWTL